MAEIRRFQLRVDGEYQKLSKSDTRKRADRHRRNIIHTVGRLLHGVQDFFSHSNFVEVRQDKFASIDDVPTPDFWSEKGRDDLLDLRRDGLVSHFFTFSFPRRCDPRPRGPLSKDQAGDGAGPIRTRWIDKRNSTTLTGHEAALYFAEEATYHVFLQLFREYPEIIPASANGSAKAPTD